MDGHADTHIPPQWEGSRIFMAKPVLCALIPCLFFHALAGKANLERGLFNQDCFKQNATTNRSGLVLIYKHCNLPGLSLFFFFSQHPDQNQLILKIANCEFVVVLSLLLAVAEGLGVAYG